MRSTSTLECWSISFVWTTLKRSVWKKYWSLPALSYKRRSYRCVAIVSEMSRWVRSGGA